MPLCTVLVLVFFVGYLEAEVLPVSRERSLDVFVLNCSCMLNWLSAVQNMAQGGECFNTRLCTGSTCGDGWQRQADLWALRCELMHGQPSFGVG